MTKYSGSPALRVSDFHKKRRKRIRACFCFGLFLKIGRFADPWSCVKYKLIRNHPSLPISLGLNLSRLDRPDFWRWLWRNGKVIGSDLESIPKLVVIPFKSNNRAKTRFYLWNFSIFTIRRESKAQYTSGRYTSGLQRDESGRSWNPKVNATKSTQIGPSI